MKKRFPIARAILGLLLGLLINQDLVEAKPTILTIQYSLGSFITGQQSPIIEIDSISFIYDSLAIADGLSQGKSLSIHPVVAIRSCFRDITTISADTEAGPNQTMIGYSFDTVPLTRWMLTFSTMGYTLNIPGSILGYDGIVGYHSADVPFKVVGSIHGVLHFASAIVRFLLTDSSVEVLDTNITGANLTDSWRGSISSLRSFISFNPLSKPLSSISSHAISSGASDIYPNPFATHTTIGFTLTKPEAVKLQLFDITGRTLREAAQECTLGTNEIELDTRDLPPGCYWYLLHGGEWERSGKVVKIEP